MHQRAPVVGVDIGGTKIAVGLVAADGTVTARRTAPTPAREGPAAVVARVAGLVDELVATVDPARRPAVMGVGTAGVVDPARGVVTASTDAIAGWAGTALAEQLRTATGLGVRVVNDVVAFLIGEQAHGVARGASDVLAVAVGTGVGGALLVDGRVLGGHGHTAGAVGHLAAPGAGTRPCPCGRDGHIEGVASGPAILAEYLRRAAVGTPVRAPAQDLREVVARAAAGDSLARSVLVEAGSALGVTLGGLVNVLSPAMVVLGGGVVSGAGEFVAALEQSLMSAVLPGLAGPGSAAVSVRRGGLGADATIVGAATVARRAATPRGQAVPVGGRV